MRLRRPLEQLYHQLAQGHPPAEALRRAKRRHLADPRWSRPHLLAGYVLVGDGGGAAPKRPAILWAAALLLVLATATAFNWHRLRRRAGPPSATRFSCLKSPSEELDAPSHARPWHARPSRGPLGRPAHGLGLSVEGRQSAAANALAGGAAAERRPPWPMQIEVIGEPPPARTRYIRP